MTTSHLHRAPDSSGGPSDPRPAPSGRPPRAFRADDHARPGVSDDASLLEAIADGDRSAFESLYHRYHRRVVGYLLRFLGTSGPVDEVLDDVMLAIWHGAGRYDGRSRPSTWIFGIAYHKALKAIDRRRRTTAREEGVEAADTEVSSEGSGPEARVARRELRRRLREAMTALSPVQRAVIELTFFYGYSYPEIAEIVDCPVNTVKTRMFHARRRLKEQLPELGIDRGMIG